MPRDGVVELDDGRMLCFCEWGDPEGLPVVHHHGTPSCRLSRHPDEAIYRRAGVRFVAYDRPGYGGSTPWPGRRVADAAADTLALTGHLGIDRFAVHGVSGGGPHALACAALLPERVVRAAVIVSPVPDEELTPEHLDGMAQINVDGLAAIRESPEAHHAYLAPYVETMRAGSDGLAGELSEQLAEPDRAVLARPELRRLRSEVDRETVRQGDAGWFDDNIAHVSPWGYELGSVSVPVRLWHGELDRLVPRAQSEHLANLIPGARLVVVPDAGHFLVDHTEEILRWLVEGH